MFFNHFILSGITNKKLDFLVENLPQFCILGHIGSRFLLIDVDFLEDFAYLLTSLKKICSLSYYSNSMNLRLSQPVSTQSQKFRFISCIGRNSRKIYSGPCPFKLMTIILSIKKQSTKQLIAKFKFCYTVYQ
jgi:hypothetical protein